MIRFSLNKEIVIEIQWFALPFLAGQLKIKDLSKVSKKGFEIISKYFDFNKN